MFLAFTGFLDGKSPKEIYEKVERGLAPTFLAGSIWIPANIVNFLLVPPPGRIAFINLVGLGWNTFLSYANQKDRKKFEMRDF